MMRHLASQQGFSLVKTLLALAVVAGIILYILPSNLFGGPLDVVNQISARIKGIVNQLGNTVKQQINAIKTKIDIIVFKFSEQIANLLDRLHMSGLAKQLKEVKDEWQKDMQSLIGVSKARGFNVDAIQQSYDEYEAGAKSWRRVEAQYWNDIRNQTQAAIKKSFKNFLNRPVGCSDFTVELQKIWEIGEAFNKDSYVGYALAKELSEGLNNPRSMDFLPQVLHWMNCAGLYMPTAGNDWFIQQFTLAIDPENGAKTYPQIIQQLDRYGNSNPILCILANVVIAEIYLNHDLFNASIERYDEALRGLYGFAKRIDQENPYSSQALGVHMTLGLLNERLCSNADLALKEFKDVVAIARRLNIPCSQYGTAHYHLAIMNLQIRDRATIEPKFAKAPATSATQTVEQLLQPEGTQPAQTPTPVPATEVSVDSGIVKGTIPPGGGRALVEEPTTSTMNPTPTPTLGREERPSEITGVVVTPVATPTPTPYVPTYADDVIKGTVSPETRRAERDIRLRPRPELGETVKMEQFTIDQLYDLSRIPADAVREFETYLKCVNNDKDETTGQSVKVARFVIGREWEK